ncbi:MAG: aquaporin [Rubrobacter sp.]|nr:aquaporin [Rubrobacter sp.]MDQ3303906.1 aquaporin [Actinomycetota bacterium]
MSDRGDPGDIPRWEDPPRRDPGREPSQDPARRYDREERPENEGRADPPFSEQEDILIGRPREDRSASERSNEERPPRSGGRGPRSRSGGRSRSSSGTGLYGSDTGSNIVRAGVAELVGTFILVFTGTAVAVAASLDQAIVGLSYDSLAIALAFGLVLVALVAALGHVSGAHLNPAVTIGLAATGKFPWNHVPVYVGAQVLGAILAAFATWITLGGPARAEASLAAPNLSPGVGIFQGFFVEMIITFILVFVVVSVATDERVPGGVAPVAVGFALAAAVFIGGPVTGGSVNPARALGPILVSFDRFDTALIYILAPIVGGVLAALLYDNFISEANAPE